MARKKVALVLSGGTSLGSYIAGALDELMTAFAARDDYEIDIIVGASAGATTAAIIAHGLSYHGGRTALHHVWVDGIDIVELLHPEVPVGEPPSLLSAQPLRELTREQLEWDPARGNGERARFCADKLILAMTLANTNGLPYLSRVEQPTAAGRERFIQYRHAEQETYELDAGLLPTERARWERIGEVARASAAIPLVFPVVQLTRNAGDRKHYIQKPEFDGEGTFWYFDGGYLNNLPVDLAWHYIGAAAANLERLLSDRRIVVVNPRRSGIYVNRSPAEPNLMEQAFGLLGAWRTESSAVHFNDEVDGPSRALRTPGGRRDVALALPGVDRPPVDVLGSFALVIPRADDRNLRGVHLFGLAAFLDRKFREYDFRRGAVDARRVAHELLEIREYDAGRPDGFYEPDDDPSLRFEIDEYDSLGQIASSRDPNRSVRAVFEEAVARRIDALVARSDAPGPDALLDPLVTRLLTGQVRERLPGLWKQ